MLDSTRLQRKSSTVCQFGNFANLKDNEWTRPLKGASRGSGSSSPPLRTPQGPAETAADGSSGNGGVFNEVPLGLALL